MRMHKCPHCGNTERFIVSAHVVQDWVVDKNGEYIDTYEDCVDVAHYPDNDDIWYCAECHKETIEEDEEEIEEDEEEIEANIKIMDLFA